MNPNLEANREVLQAVERHIHLLEQEILPPELETQAMQIFKTRDAAIEGMLKARWADKINIEHIIGEYEKGVMLG